MSATAVKVGQALTGSIQSLVCWLVERGRQSGGGEWKTGGQELASLANTSTLATPLPPPPTPMHKETWYALYKGGSDLSPYSCWKRTRHVKWNLLLKQTPGLGLLAAETQTSLGGLAPRPGRTPNAQAAL